MASARTLLASTTLGSNTASVVLSGIPQTYKDLIVEFDARLSADESPAFYLQFNGDTAANYSYQTLRTTYNGSRDALRATSTTLGAGIMWIPGSTGVANAFGSAEVFIPGYTASTTKQISMLSSSPSTSTTSPEIGAAISCGTWQGTTAITSITFYNSSRNVVTNSSFFLYGLAG